MSEDTWLCDPRRVVRFALGTDRLRVHPGEYPDSIGVLNTVARMATAIDDLLQDEYGFGISDATEVVLRHMDDVIRRRSPHWPAYCSGRDDEDPEMESLDRRVQRIAGTPVLLAPSEVTVAEPDGEPRWLDDCVDPGRARRALDWMTFDAADVGFEAADGPLLGPALRMRTNGTARFVPASFALSTLCSAAARLAATPFANADEADERLTAVAASRAIAMLSPDDANNTRDLLVTSAIGLVRDHRHVVAVEVVAALHADKLIGRHDDARNRLLELDATELAASNPRLSPTADLVQLVVYDGPHFLAFRPGQPVVTVNLAELDALVADAVDTEDFDSIWQFFEDVAREGHRLVGCSDLLDAWRHWRHYGTFDPTCTPHAVLVDPRRDERRWNLDTVWEPLDSVLGAAGLGTRQDWARAALGDNGTAILRTGTDIALVASDPPTILLGRRDNNLVARALDPGLPTLLANGIVQALTEAPAMAELFRKPKSPVVASIEIAELDHISEADDADQEPLFEVGVHPDLPHFRLIVGFSWIRMLFTEPATAHECLGTVLASVLGEMTDAGIDAATAATAAWQMTAPVAILRHEPGLAAPPASRGRLVSNKATTARAYARLAAQVRRASVEAGVYRGGEATKLCRDVLTPAGHAAIGEAVATWSPDALRVAVATLGSVHGQRRAAMLNLELALAGPWAAEFRSTALKSGGDVPTARPSEVLVEWLVMSPPDGDVIPDSLDISEVVRLIEVVLTIGVVRAGAVDGLHDSTVTVFPYGLVHVAPVADDLDSLDLHSYMLASRQHRLRTLDGDLDPGEPLDLDRRGEEHPFQSIFAADVPHSLRKIDATLHDDIGTGVDGVLAVLATATSLDVDSDGAATIDADALSGSASAWSSLPKAVTDAAVRHLTLSPSGLRSESLLYWEVERRSHRVAARPLIDIGDGRLLVSPFIASTTQQIFADAFLDGRLPWPRAQMSNRLLDALAGRRRQIGKQHERVLAASLTGTQLPFVVGLEQRDAAAAGIELPGEVDALVATENGTIWVCEAKDLARSVAPRAMRSRVRDYVDEYIPKLAAKVTAVRDAVGATVRLLGLQADRPWQVRGVFVTRLVEPAAFLVPPKALFVVIHDLSDLLVDRHVPAGGHYRIGERAESAHRHGS